MNEMHRPLHTIIRLSALVALTGCSQNVQPQANIPSPSVPTQIVAVALSQTVIAPASVPSATSALPTATPVPLTPTVAPTITPIPPTPTPDPVAGLTIPDLRARHFGDGDIEIGAVWRRGNGYTTYRMSYPVDGLHLTGLLHVPDSEGPFPLIIANRGHIDRERYQPGMDSRAFSDLMARNGYLVVAPDYRGYAGGDDGPNPFYTGYYADVLGLIPLAQELPMARRGKVGMWGHSRGASITIAALTITDQIAAAVVYAPAPADLAEDYERRRRQASNRPGDETWPFPPGENPDAYRRVSPINYFDRVSAPVMLHHGTADTTVDAGASIAIADELRAAGKEVTLYLYEGSGHALEGRAYALYAQRTLDFFHAHLGH